MKSEPIQQYNCDWCHKSISDPENIQGIWYKDGQSDKHGIWRDFCCRFCVSEWFKQRWGKKK